VVRIADEATAMNEHHHVTDVKVAEGFLSLVVDGQHIRRSLRDLSALLSQASDQELAEFEVSPSGYGIHWPRIDEDISIDGLLGIVHTPQGLKKSA
jgi:hypothetical protein